MGLLYINSKGTVWRKHSYSSGNLFDQCPYAYYLRKILGWKTKDDKASFKFGRALEQAIEFYHNNDGLRGVEDFEERWAVHKDDKELKFTKTENNWDSLNRAGREMMRLYAIRQPSLPIPLGAASVFQREYSKEMYPGDPVYGEIEDAGKLDIIAYVEPNHPMLPIISWTASMGPLRPIIVDIKTSCLDFPETPGISAFDKQLRRYSWLSGIRDVGLLWFKKVGHRLSKGVSVTLLEDVNLFDLEMKAGDEAVVAQVTDEGVWIVRNDRLMDVMDAAQGLKPNGNLNTTKAARARKERWLVENAARVPENYLTRQRLQFNCGYVTTESAEDAGLIAARQIVQIANAWKTKKWPNTFGIRFPNDDRRDPYFRAFVLGDKTFKEQYFVKSEEESFDDLFMEDADGNGDEL